MTRYLILAQSEVTARALGAWLELIGDRPVEIPSDDERVLASQPSESLAQGFVSCFRRLGGRLDRAVAESAGEGLVVLVDSVNPRDLSAVGSPQGWNRIISLLILTFPEVRWVFGVSGGAGVPTWWTERHGLSSLFGPHFDPLFDGTGLRSHVRGLTAFRQGKGASTPIAPWIPHRKEWCASLDDETAYAYLHAYAAYRNGFRAFAVHEQRLADHLLGGRRGNDGGAADPWKLGNPFMTLEDYYLGFPDKESTLHLASLEVRDVHWPKLNCGSKTGPYRYFVTSGHGRSLGAETLAVNKLLLRKLNDHGRGGTEVRKPIPGIFALWSALGLDWTLRGNDENGRPYRGLAPGFFWPPSAEDSAAEDGTGHSAPGLLLLVAELLIRRAQSLAEDVNNVPDAVRGAVLATSALELLGPKTPTTAREALELKHRFEVFAECQFGGVEFNLSLEDRFSEIRSEVQLLGSWYGRDRQDVAVVNGELTIISRLRGIFRAYEEFDEEERCLSRTRILHRRAWWHKARRNPLNWLVWPLKTYIEFLLGSLTRFTAAVLVWWVGLFLAFSVVQEDAELHEKYTTPVLERTLRGVAVSPPNSPETRFEGEVLDAGNPPELSPFVQAASGFLGAEPSPAKHWAWLALWLLASVSGFVHLGIFISQVYSMVARK